MILQSLVRYYEILADAGEIAKPGYCSVGVSFALSLTPQGELVGVIPQKISRQRGNKAVELPRPMIVPEQEKKTVGIKSNFLCENSSYMLGVDNKGKPERTAQCFEAFARLHRSILEKADCAAARAILAFLDSWRPEKAAECKVLREDYDELTGGANLVFSVEGVGFAHEDACIRQAWDAHCATGSDAAELPCLVTGKKAPAARLHPSIKGVKGAQSMGASLVSFNAPAYESFGHEQKDQTGQGLNAPVGEYAAFAYTTALNFLLADKEHVVTMGDTTIVYYAVSPRKIYRNLFGYALSPTAVKAEPEITADMETQALLRDIFQRIVEGRPVAEEAAGGLDANTHFYVLGLAPNAARLSVRFFLADTFGNILGNVARHYRDLEIDRSPADFEYLPVWKLLDETVSSKVRVREASPLLSGAVMRSILSGLPYPRALLSGVMLRIRAEQDDEDHHIRKVTRGRAAIIKACLLRQYNNDSYREVLTVSLKDDSTNCAYTLGRLFAVLEKTQQDANPGIKSTIKDRYFTSACATPASVFPILLRLSNHHIAKSDYGKSSEIRIGRLMDKLDAESHPFPNHLSLEEQGIFILGYYHQQRANYTKINREAKEDGAN